MVEVLAWLTLLLAVGWWAGRSPDPFAPLEKALQDLEAEKLEREARELLQREHERALQEFDEALYPGRAERRRRMQEARAQRIYTPTEHLAPGQLLQLGAIPSQLDEQQAPREIPDEHFRLQADMRARMGRPQDWTMDPRTKVWHYTPVWREP